jgi:hypothetical protein
MSEGKGRDLKILQLDSDSEVEGAEASWRSLHSRNYTIDSGIGLKLA